MSVPGRHNVLNALAACAACYFAGIGTDVIADALENFTGAGRRSEFKGKFNGADVYDDYAHMPAEIKTTLEAFGNKKYKRITCAFQPHNYSRTSMHFEEFAGSFGLADEALLLDIYSVREENTYGVESSGLAAAIAKRGKRARYFESFGAAAEYLKKSLSPRELLITMGAGDVYILADTLLKSN